MEDRINTYGVTGATVVVQGSNELVIEIPNGTGADVAQLGKAAVLNFRGVMTGAQPVTCSAKPTPPPTSAAPASPCVANPFAAVVAKDPSLKTLLDQSPKNLGALNAEECPSPSM